MSDSDAYVFHVSGSELLDDVEGQLLMLEGRPEENGRLDTIEDRIAVLRAEADLMRYHDVSATCDRIVRLARRLRGRPDAVREGAIHVMLNFVAQARRYIDGMTRMAG